MDSTQQKGGPTIEEEAQIVKGASIELNFQVKDQPSFPLTFNKEVDVNWLRYQVANYLNIPLQTVELKLDGKKLLGPLSLEDYPQIVNGSTIETILVEEDQ